VGFPHCLFYWHNGNMRTLSIVVLAAGQGKRMQSAIPKVLHEIAGKPMLAHVLDECSALKPAVCTVVYGHGGEAVQRAMQSSRDLTWVEQKPQLGTAHAVMQAVPSIGHTNTTLILYGDVPLIQIATMRRLVAEAEAEKLAWLTMEVEDPSGLGRILRNASGAVQAIVEDKDATEAQRTIREINTGFLALPTQWLSDWLPRIHNNNAQKEYYLTDILEMAVAERKPVVTLSPDHKWEVSGVNTKLQLATLERQCQRNHAQRLLEQGVTLLDPDRIDVRGELTAGQDVRIDVNVVFEGKVVLGNDVSIGANCVLRNCSIGDKTEVLPFTLIDAASVGRAARIGPFARVRPDSTLGDDVHIGNFVEVKASTIGDHSKANHLAYIGDATVGVNVNVGAGTITCNYDGANKHRTIIGDNVHIGSDVQLVAPITVASGATIAAGTTLWKDAPADALTLNPKTQTSNPTWKRPNKESKH
jgi:bifunctional UDP-N-acetylglucosamine pyrophosphorylase / glucosamine-1-phosphate N-acetyltransferase